jgi:excisionase family DNA binding protein
MPKTKLNANATPAMPDLLDRRLLLRVKEYAQLTGTPTPTVYALIAAGKIQGVVRIGASIRIPVAAIRDLVA